MPTYIVEFPNVGTRLETEFKGIQDAVEAAKKACFEAVILCDGRVYATWNPIGGFNLIDFEIGV